MERDRETDFHRWRASAVRPRLGGRPARRPPAPRPAAWSALARQAPGLLFRRGAAASAETQAQALPSLSLRGLGKGSWSVRSCAASALERRDATLTT